MKSDDKHYIMKKVLFICSQNKLRSPTAEHIFADYVSLEVDSAGLNRGSYIELCTEQVEWADIIFVMEQRHREKLLKNFRSHINGQRVICLDIPDDYAFMDPGLIKILNVKVKPYL